ncbi:MAG TPA: hypothetical protein VJ086_06440, partial [Rubrobacteraceae bacterium]|nr:hypothetical protein [Rubrobacteraceae bacterium]
MDLTGSYPFDFALAPTPAGFFLVFFDEDFGAAFLRVVLDARSPPFALPLLSPSALAALASAAALRLSCCFEQDMSMQVIQGRRP